MTKRKQHKMQWTPLPRVQYADDVRRAHLRSGGAERGGETGDELADTSHMGGFRRTASY